MTGRINLIPESRANLLIRDYYCRLGVVALILINILFVISAIMLLPAYVSLTSTIHGKEAQLERLSDTLAASGDTALSQRIATLSTDLKRLSVLQDTPPVSSTVRNILATSRSGIVITGLDYTATTRNGSRTVSIMGTAASRDALRTFQIALQQQPFAQSVDLPVSAYAKDTNIPFTITVILSP